MSWGAQNRPKDAKTPSVGRGMSETKNLNWIVARSSHSLFYVYCNITWVGEKLA
jgi:hypothetical protein